MKYSILCVDDDEFIRSTVTSYLKKEAFNVYEAANAQETYEQLDKHSIDIILLDLILPDENGISIIKNIRKSSEIPIIIISSKEDVLDRILGIEVGADDYLTKPVSTRELKARINAVLKRLNNQSEASVEVEDVTFGDWVAKPSQYQVFDKDGVSANLTTNEFLMLWTLLSCPNQTFTREQLLEVYEKENNDSFDRAVDIQITRIRKKLKENAKKPQFIKTVRGIGYIFTS